MTNTFEFNKETVNNIVTATKYDKLTHTSRYGYGYSTSFVNDTLREINRRGEMLNKIIAYYTQNPHTRLRVKELSQIILGKDYFVHELTSLLHKLVQAGFLKREIEEQAIMVEKKVWVPTKGCQTEKKAILAKIPYFSLA